ncbi:MAG: hypothetical protein AAGA25_09975 [Planctomycetota bacterium]
MPAPAEQHERPGVTVKGPWIVAATLSLFVIVPLIVVVIVMLTDQERQPDPPLDWSQRKTWPRTFYTTFKSLERGMMSNARTNEVYKDLGFHVTPDEQLAVIRCMTIAKQPELMFVTQATRARLEYEIEQNPNLFYAHFLLATWHAWHGDDAAAEPHYTTAFANAPAALMRHHVTPDGESAANTPVPTLAIAADQIIDDELDRSLVLVFPSLTTDADGTIYLPMYKAILRYEDPALPPGVADLQEKYRWFTFAGRIGRMPDETLPLQVDSP